jgi:adenylate kinase
VLLGPPGAGKGTQAALLARSADLEHVSTGDLLRAAIASGSDLGRSIQATVDAGRLVADEVVAKLVAERVGLGRPLLLDGFPRTLRQADMLDALMVEAGLPLPAVLELEVSSKDVVRRLSARRSCPSCGPRPAGESSRCGQCGAALFTRPDDAESVVLERLRVYREQTSPLSARYEAQGRLFPVDGGGAVAEVAAQVLEAARRALGPAIGRTA